MILIVSKHLKRVSTWALLRELVRRIVAWCLDEIQIRAEVVVASVRLSAYSAGVSLEEVISPRTKDSQR